MATTLTTDNIQTIDDLTAVISLVNADELILYSSADSAHRKIACSNLPTALGYMKLRSTVSASITTATTLTDTGLTVDVPAGKPFFIICRGGWTNNYCTELSVSNTYGVVFSKEYSGDGQQSFCASYCGYEPVSRTYALYAKYAGASSNTVYMYLFY